MRKWQTILRFQIHFLSLIYIRVKIIGDICCECLFLTFCKGLSDEKTHINDELFHRVFMISS